MGHTRMFTGLVSFLICGFVLSGFDSPVRAQESGRKAKSPAAKKAPKPKAKSIKLPPNVTLERDVVYGKGGDRDLHLDLFLPKKEGDDLRPGIVFVHGGGWRAGSRSQFHKQAAYLAGKGYVGACIEYRLSSEAKFPAAVEDCKCAVRWMRANAKRLGVDPDRVATCGGSAGGHLAAMLGVTDKSLGLEGKGGHAEFSSKANLVVDFNGVSDLVVLGKEAKKLDNALTKFLGGPYKDMPDVYAKASPILHVDKSDPPFLLLHGDADTTVPVEQSVQMAEKLRSVGVPAELYKAEGAGHGFFNRGSEYDATLERMEKFLDKHFRSKEGAKK